MINVKDKIYLAIKKQINNVSDSYPASWADTPAVQYVEEENKVAERTENKENKSYIRYKIDIWHNRSTSEATLKIDAAISELGLVRTFCQDVPDPSGLKHKVLRYEGIIDNETEMVYWSERG